MGRFMISIHFAGKISLALLTLVLLTRGLFPCTASMGQKEAHDHDRVALMHFKSKVKHDPHGVMNSWNSSHHFCRWEGIQCGRKHKRVIGINLSDKDLVGILSPFLGNLSFLRVLMLGNNAFQGEIPPQFGQLFRLRVLNLSWNSLEGESLANLSQCSNLMSLKLSHNQLVGRIPPAFGSLQNLELLSIHSNNLTGPIPPSIGNITSLSSLMLANNHLEGKISEALGQLRSLRDIGLGRNKLYGIIPSSIFNLSRLEILSVAENQLQGSLPSGLGHMLPHLQFLQLRNNQFTSSLPISLTNASELTRIDIGRNRFKGKIAIDFGGLQNLGTVFAASNNFGNGEMDGLHFLSTMTNCSRLEALDIQNNQLVGVLPNSIGNLSRIFRFLSLGENQIYGGIPSTLGNLVNLNYLILQRNQLTGTIPSTIGYLQKLNRLSLSSNLLSGKIPESLGNLSSLVELYLGNNTLEGSIPPSLENCRALLFLGLDRNNLSGLIPKEIFMISSLSIYLGISKNHLSGTIPLEVGNLTNLAEFEVNENHLSGELPVTFGGCSSLQRLSLAGNSFRGFIPKFLSSMRGIQFLDLSQNKFSGQIPQFLERLSIKTLNLSFNELVGEVPTQGVFGNASAISIVGNRGLCGGILELHLPKCHIVKDSRKDNKHFRVILPVVLTAFILFVGVTLILIYRKFLWKRRSRKPSSSRRFLLNVNYRQLFQATNGFSTENLIGVGSFGSVYKGNLSLTEERNLSVAVKVFNPLRRGAFKSFSAECEALRNIRHRNLVKVITACSSIDFKGNEFKALVYEFMPNGSLENWLHSSEEDEQNKSQRPNLLQRIDVAIDVAGALDYLHHRCHMKIAHCDLKPSNILLDNDLTAHVGDFGLAKFLPLPHQLQESSSAGIRGTIGYTAPEYGLGAEVSSYGDVYSFGILLLEMMTGKRPTHAMFNEGLDLRKYVEMAVPDRVMDIADPVLLYRDGEDVEFESKCSILNDRLISLLKVGLACSVYLPQDRMNMAEAFSSLKSIRDTFSTTGL